MIFGTVQQSVNSRAQISNVGVDVLVDVLCGGILDLLEVAGVHAPVTLRAREALARRALLFDLCFYVILADQHRAVMLGSFCRLLGPALDVQDVEHCAAGNQLVHSAP